MDVSVTFLSPRMPASSAVESYRSYQAAAADQDDRIPRELAPHSGTRGENPDFSASLVASVRKMIF